MQNFETQDYLYLLSVPFAYFHVLFCFVLPRAQESGYVYTWDFTYIQNWLQKLRKTSWNDIYKAILCCTRIMLLFIAWVFSFLDEVWEIDGGMEWHQENQGKLRSMSKGYQCTAFGKLCLLRTDYVSSRQKLQGFPGGAVVKSLPANAGDTG